MKKFKIKNESLEDEENSKKLKKSHYNKIEMKQKEIEEETKQLIELETKLEEVILYFHFFSLPFSSFSFTSFSLSLLYHSFLYNSNPFFFHF